MAFMRSTHRRAGLALMSTGMRVSMGAIECAYLMPIEHWNGKEYEYCRVPILMHTVYVQK